MAHLSPLKQILIIDDDRDFSETLAELCTLSGFEAKVTETGREGLLRAYSLQPDLVILDMNLPDFDGLDIIQEIRKETFVPLIVLSGRTNKGDRILALELGADDYITKPFDNIELISRIKAILRRCEWNVAPRTKETAASEALIMQFPWYVDFKTMCIRSQESQSEVSLTSREVAILEKFAHCGDAVVEKETLLAAIGYPRNYDHGPLEVCLSRFKTKLNRENIPYPIRSVRGVGYRFHLSD